MPHGQAQAVASIGNGGVQITIGNGGQELWHVQWIRSGLPLSQAKHYRVTFRASAASARTLHAYMGRNGHPWTPYNNYPAFTITNEPRDYFFDLFMKDIADPDARIVFDLGRSTIQVVFYEIRLEEVM